MLKWKRANNRKVLAAQAQDPILKHVIEKLKNDNEPPKELINKLGQINKIVKESLFDETRRIVKSLWWSIRHARQTLRFMYERIIIPGNIKNRDNESIPRWPPSGTPGNRIQRIEKYESRFYGQKCTEKS